jgi:GrpB-like predicted nucleotidyltransferase (UPF0157 family)
MIFLKPEEYLPQINAIYDLLKPRVLQVLPSAEVEHIGSSAIRGAISKGDLDILVRVPKSDFEAAILKIQSLGFTIKEGTLRTESLCMLETKEFGEDVAIQLIEGDSEFEFFIKFRDLLNSNPQLVDQYNELKMKSVGMTPENYRAEKSKFIESIL